MKRARLTLFLGYTGDEYNGMQWQKEAHVRTVENELVRKLHAEGLLRTDVFIELVKLYKWSRAARTDKGVHALINSISCVFSLKDDFWLKNEKAMEAPLLTEKETEMPDETSKVPPKKREPKYRLDKDRLLTVIRSLFTTSPLTIYSIKEVSGHFDVRHAVKTRTYCYICPLFLFDPHQPTADRLTPEQTLEKINRLCQQYVGTRNYHNYSNGIKAKDPSAMRYMLAMRCEPFPLEGILEEPWEAAPAWVRFTLHGQSFIYHQIRKMVGMIMQLFMFAEPEQLLENTFFNNQLKILLAPAEGLYLESLRFDGYNRLAEIPEPLEFTNEQPLLEAMRLRIHRKILDSERTAGKFTEWLNHIKEGNGPV